MAHLIRWIRLVLNILFFVITSIGVFNYPASIYLCRQGLGQLNILIGTESIESYTKTAALNDAELENLNLIEAIKRYSIDSLAYKETKNFTRVYNQNNKPVLWVITASSKYEINPYEWRFPLIGSVSYKGFFSEELAKKEFNKLSSAGFDVGIRTVSAWSTLGWLNDPLLSNQLSKSKGSFCNLLFHELFHATMFKAGQVEDNENLANFIADKATRLFLKEDSTALKNYISLQEETKVLMNILTKETREYKTFLETINNKPQKLILKQQALVRICNRILNQTSISESRRKAISAEILTEQNAFFIDYLQYYSKQDSLENVFNNFYKGNLKMMVQSLSE
jgi:predicted aminopeptidase